MGAGGAGERGEECEIQRFPRKNDFAGGPGDCGAGLCSAVSASGVFSNLLWLPTTRGAYGVTGP